MIPLVINSVFTDWVRLNDRPKSVTHNLRPGFTRVWDCSWGLCREDHVKLGPCFAFDESHETPPHPTPNCKQSSRVHFHLYDANCQVFFYLDPWSWASQPCITRSCFFVLFQMELEPPSQRRHTRFLSCNNKLTGQLPRGSVLSSSHYCISLTEDVLWRLSL